MRSFNALHVGEIGAIGEDSTDRRDAKKGRKIADGNKAEEEGGNDV